MRILVVSQYFAPEPGATQNRLGAFADGLAALGHDVTVVCEQPNHPAGVFHRGYGRRPLMTARTGKVTVHRLWVATSPVKSTARRLAFYGTFAAGAGALTAVLPRHDVALITSPPLPGALTAAGAMRARRTPYVLDVRDLWPSAAQALGELSNRRVLMAFERAERWAYRGAAAVTTTTRPFCRHIDRVAERPVSVLLENGALDSLVNRTPAPAPAPEPFVVGYTGNFGIAQGLGVVLDAAEALRDSPGPPVRFRLVGDGPVREWLLDERRRRHLDTVEIKAAVPASDVPAVLADCHALLVPLRDNAVLDDFVPSKLYDAMAAGRPALVAARGEAAMITQDTGCGLTVPPEDGAALATAIRSLQADPERTAAMARNGRAAGVERGRSRQIERLQETLSRAAQR